MSIEVNKRMDMQFRKLLSEVQRELFTFIALMLGNTADAKDVLQETNLSLLKKASQYDPERPFSAWARSIAYYEVLTFRQQQKRERLVFDDEMLDAVSVKVMKEDDVDESERSQQSDALKKCLARLNSDQRRLVNQRYQQNVSVKQMAQQRTCTETAVSTWLYRIRKVLATCIENRRLDKEANI